MCAVIGWNSLPYKNIEHRARELKLSRYLPKYNVSDHFPHLSLAFFRSLKWNFVTSETANSKRRTKQIFVIMSSAVIDVTITWAETRVTLLVSSMQPGNTGKNLTSVGLPLAISSLITICNLPNMETCLVYVSFGSILSFPNAAKLPTAAPPLTQQPAVHKELGTVLAGTD